MKTPIMNWRPPAVLKWTPRPLRTTMNRPPVEETPDELEFQMVSARKAAKTTIIEDTALPIETGNKYLPLAENKSYPASISLKPQGDHKAIIKEIAEKFPGTENRWIYDYVNIKPPSEESILQILALLNERKAEYLLNESYDERPIKVVIKDLSDETDPQEIVDDLTSKGYAINRITQMKNYRLKKLLPMFLVEIKKKGKYLNIYNEKSICYFRVKIETYRKKAKATICYNCSGFYHAARNCHLKPKCIKCGGEHPTRECSIKDKIAEPKCVNCGESGHLAAWKGCKSYPIIKKPSYRQNGKSYAQAASEKVELPTKKKTEEKSDDPFDLEDIKDSMKAIKEVKMLLDEFPTLLEAARLSKTAKTRTEKVLIVLNALVGA
ncbi:hypothetical protein AVEN_191256-1 [Araneus ventricosus]|uniref:Nucleic-acid-binding protein from transposon X-element n=1 Tax=Araneus ventricosus TaxID=182803 RepID=A0A4Y2GB85_ARAVE|nr:hypothetical protein AVEN_191256-1 [Araneus ventricosus]